MNNVTKRSCRSKRVLAAVRDADTNLFIYLPRAPTFNEGRLNIFELSTAPHLLHVTTIRVRQPSKRAPSTSAARPLYTSARSRLLRVHSLHDGGGRRTRVGYRFGP